MQAMTEMKQPDIQWDCGTQGIGVLVSDSLMFEREQPTPSDPNMAHFYGLALPMLKRGLPVTPVQLENVTLPGFLTGQRVLMLSYQGQKPQTADVHAALADWVKKGGVLVMVDDDKDPYNQVREWWNEDGKNDRIPRRHLFDALGVKDEDFSGEVATMVAVGQGKLIWVRESPVRFALSAEGDERLAATAKTAATAAGLEWKETNYLTLHRGPYVIGAGLDEAVAAPPKVLTGRFVNLFDPALAVQHSVTLSPGARVFLLDLDAVKAGEPKVVASACKALLASADDHLATWTVEGVNETPAIILISTDKAPRSIQLDQHPLDSFTYDSSEQLLSIHFPNASRPRKLCVEF